jgi:hypothetical protein
MLLFAPDQIRAPIPPVCAVRHRKDVSCIVPRHSGQPFRHFLALLTENCLRRHRPLWREPWSVGRDAAYVYFEDEAGRRASAKLLTHDEARRIATNIAKLPYLLQGGAKA